MSPRVIATSVVAISSVRRLKRRLIFKIAHAANGQSAKAKKKHIAQPEYITQFAVCGISWPTFYPRMKKPATKGGL
jgi:hypothetical protein